MGMSSIYLAVPLMVVLAIFQSAALPRFPIAGVIPQLPFLFALSWGLIRGPNEGMVWAFVAGFCLDLFSAGPIGVTSLAFMAAILAASGIANALPANRVLLPILLALVSTPIYFLTYQLLLQLLGRTTGAEASAGPSLTGPTVLGTLPTITLLHVGLFLPLHWLMLFVRRLIRPRAVRVGPSG
jgi:rod shape-determining protein MreD